MLNLDAVRTIAAVAHHGTFDKIGDPYFWHVEAVAAGLVPFEDDELLMGALLHDIVEDTPWTIEYLLRVGVSPRVVHMVDSVTNLKGQPYPERIKRILTNPDGLRIKISDNAHNSRKDRNDRIADPATRERLKVKYRAARDQLWKAADPEDIRKILEIVNPGLLPEMQERGIA